MTLVVYKTKKVLLMKILVTGFTPFGDEKTNPSQDIVSALPKSINGARIIPLIIPTVRFKSIQRICEVIEKEKPDVVISVGQAGGRFSITPELVAINRDDYAISDNEGNQPIDETISLDGPAAYFTTLPIKEMVKQIRAHHIPAECSTTAGTFVCNHVFYGISDYIYHHHLQIKNGFIHLPFSSVQALHHPHQPSLSMDEMQRGLELAISCCTRVKD